MEQDAQPRNGDILSPKIRAAAGCRYQAVCDISRRDSCFLPAILGWRHGRQTNGGKMPPPRHGGKTSP
jgi:hypothetical protein